MFLITMSPLIHYNDLRRKKNGGTLIDIQDTAV